MKLLICLALLTTSQFANAISKQERTCVAIMVYHEARGLTKQDWLKVANVALNRSINYSKYHYGSRSKHLCDIVKSPQFTSSKKLLSPIQELTIFNNIRQVLSKGNWRTATDSLYFSTLNNKMVYAKKFK